jgi:hypothetical protein
MPVVKEPDSFERLARDAGVEKEGGRPKMSEAADLDHPPR